MAMERDKGGRVTAGGRPSAPGHPDTGKRGAARSAVDGRVARAEAKRQARQTEILAAAGRVFSERGYHASSVADVIEAAGISRGTFYLYFDSKETLFLALMDAFTERIIRVVEVVDPEAPDPWLDVYENLRRVVDVVFEHRELTLLVFRQSLGLNPEVDARLRRFYGFLREMIDGALEKGAKAGLIRKVDVPLVSTALIGAIKELFYSYLVSVELSPPDRAEVTQGLIDFALRGLVLVPQR